MSIAKTVLVSGETGSANSHTFPITVSAAQSRLVIAAIRTSNGGAIHTVTYDGASQSVVGGTSDAMGGGIATVVNPTAGAHTVVITSPSSAAATTSYI